MENFYFIKTENPNIKKTRHLKTNFTNSPHIHTENLKNIFKL